MAVHYACPRCKRPMKSPERFAGRQVVCPACKTELIVPEERAKREAREDRQARPRAEVGGDAVPESQMETGEFEDAAEAVRRELDEAES